MFRRPTGRRGCRGRAPLIGLEPSEALTVGTVLQTGRLIGAQLRAAFVQIFVRVRHPRLHDLGFALISILLVMLSLRDPPKPVR